MFTVIIPTSNAEMALSHSLAALVSAAAAGVVREVIIADCHSTDSTVQMADATGCMIVESDRPGGAAAKLAVQRSRRGEWLLFLPAGVTLEPGWHHEALNFIEKIDRQHQRSNGKAKDYAAIFRFAVDDLGPKARLIELMAGIERWLLGVPRDSQGLVISRSHYAALGGHQDIGWLAMPELARRIGRHRTFVLRAHAYCPVELHDAAIGAGGQHGLLSRLGLAVGLPARWLAR